MKRKLIVLSTVLFIAACGGGGGGSSPSNPTVPSPPATQVPAPTPLLSTSSIEIYGQAASQQGDAVGFAVVAKSGLRVNQINWQQDAGPNINIIAPTMQTIGFDTLAVGDYQFTVSGTLTNGNSFQESVSLTVTNDNIVNANIRLDHAASEQANISLHIDSFSDKTVTSWEWEQVAGSIDVTLTSDEAFAFFDAPTVTKDEIVVIEGTLVFDDGTRASDTSLIVIKDVQIAEDGFFPRFSEKIVSTDMFAYNSNSPYLNALEACVYNNTVERSCTFSQLPLLGQQATVPSVEDVMDRVLVSHGWMGDRFKEFLENSATGEDMRKLLRATTAIVISYEVRPSFYWTATGAIYLDAANFWVTPQERDTLNASPDFRSDFGSDLTFLIPWRYVKDNQSFIRRDIYPRTERLTKSFSDMEASVSWLMYHELGHANDFFPPQSWSQVQGSDSPLTYANDNEANSTAFSNANPLDSQEMKDLGQVSFFGALATAEQRSYSPDTITSFFEPDRAPAYYSYSTIREDYATLFERFMMLYRLGAVADTAIVEQDDDDQYPVTWGQRNRINDDSVKLRTAIVVEQILPELDVQVIQESLVGTQMLTPGISYFDQIDLSEEASTQLGKPSSPSANRQNIWQHIRNHHQGRPRLPEVKKQD